MATLSFDIVLFGAAGDLSLRKLFPALFRAYSQDQLAPDTRIFAMVRHAEERAHLLERIDDAFHHFLDEHERDLPAWQAFLKQVQVHAVDIADADADWRGLADILALTPEKVRLFYLAIPPELFDVCCQRLADHGLITEQSRVVVEKPLGYDANTANAINDRIARFFSEPQIFRIDHYLGKETVQNLLALRFSNILFEQLWNSHFIDHIQISIAETVGLEGRAGFYDHAGALRDMVQNHLLQLLCLIAMEPPNKLNAKNIRAEKLKVLDALRPITGEAVEKNTVRGQYVAGFVGREPVPGYLEELGRGDSYTETFVAIKAHIDNWRWARVPFYLRTGKRMRSRFAEIVLQFKDVAHRVYDSSVGAMQPNRLIIRLQPDEGMRLTLMAKKMDSAATRLQPVTLNLSFTEALGGYRSDAYKRLLLDAAKGDASLFIHRDEVDRAWAFVDPIIEQWQRTETPPDVYPAGTWGPEAAEYLLARDGHRWLNPY